MESIIRNVRDIDGRDRQALEHVRGQELKENQKIIIQVVTVSDEATVQEKPGNGTPVAKLPDWCNVLAGLSDAQIAEFEEIVLQR
jgi:hypothetical protein